MGLVEELLGARKRRLLERLKPPRPEPRGQNHYVVVVLDSCRFDTWLCAAPPILGKLGQVERRYSYASWTAPSHYNLLMGLLPHRSPPRVFASDYYKADFANYRQRLRCEEFSFERMVPSLYLPTVLRRELGYEVHARVSIPVLNPATPLNRDFDSFVLMERHNDMHALVDSLVFPEDRPAYYLLNVGETHFPYAPAGEDPALWPRIEELFPELHPQDVGGAIEPPGRTAWDEARLGKLLERQKIALRSLEPAFEKLFDLVPRNTYLTVTSDHGELFGEGGYFGHGPIQHERVFEVPFVEGQLR